MDTVKSVLLIVLALCLIILIIQNTAPVNARFLWIRAEMPVFMLLFFTTAIGYLLGMITILLVRKNKPDKTEKEREKDE